MRPVICLVSAGVFMSVWRGMTSENNPEREIYILAKGYFLAKVRKGIGYTLVFELA